MKLPALPGFDKNAFDKYLSNTGWLMFGKVLNMVAQFAIARHLVSAEFGDLSFADAFTFIAAAIASLGLDTFVIREIINEPTRRDEILGTAFWLRVGASGLIIPATVGTYSFFHAHSGGTGVNLAVIVGLLSFAGLFKSFNVIDSYFQSQVQSRFVVRVQNVCLFISSAVKIALVALNAALIWFAIALVFDAAMLATGLAVMYQVKGHRLRSWRFVGTRARMLLNQSWPLIISAVMISIYMRVDAVMLKSRGSSEVAVYTAAAKISEAWYFIPSAIITSVLPAIIHARRTDKAKYLRRLSDLYDLLVAISLPVALLVNVYSDEIIRIAYGEKYPGAAQMLSIHIWSAVIVFLGTASSQYLLAEGLNKLSFIRTGIGAVINVALNLWLIEPYGGVGASIATLVAYFVSVFAILLFPSTRKQGITLLKSLFLISLARKVLRHRFRPA